MSHVNPSRILLWSWTLPTLSCLIAALVFSGAVSDMSVAVLLPAAVLLAGAVFASVHHAEILALRIGEPFGAILLAVCVTIIEVAVIVSIMLSGAEGNEEVARDTVFAAVIIVVNGVIGLCLVLGGRRHHEQSFHLDAAAAAFAVLGTLATISFVLPNYVQSGGARQFSGSQLAVVGLVSLALYGVFLFVQTIRHRSYFIDEPSQETNAGETVAQEKVPSRLVTTSAVLLPLSLVAVVLLAKILSHPLDSAVDAACLPQAFVGVIVAAVVLLPEGIASVRSALANRLQNSVNLVLGSALASIGLTFLL